MPPRKRSPSSSSSPPPIKPSPTKKPKLASSTPSKKVAKVEVKEESDLPGQGIWKDWPAPRNQMENAKQFILEACVAFLPLQASSES